MEKKYVNGMLFKEKTFDNGGTLLRLSVKVSDFIEELRESLIFNNYLNEDDDLLRIIDYLKE